MQIGLVGKPNAGKSTFFSAATLINVPIANYPFTTIEPNRGIAFIRTKCVHTELNVVCKPRVGMCVNGTRYIPVELIDVAGLVPDAHKGKGLGNKFLDDLRQADCFIHVIDASGSTKFDGTICNVGEHDPRKDIEFLDNELNQWLHGIIMRDMDRIRKRAEIKGESISTILAERLAGLGITEPMINEALSVTGLTEEFAKVLRRKSKPMLIAANKWDIAPETLTKKLKEFKDEMVVFVSAEYELALRKADKAGLIKYLPGDSKLNFTDVSKLSSAQINALKKIDEFLQKFHSTGVQECLESAVYKLMKRIVVYPVEDENHYTDKDGNVLPDAFLVSEGTTARDLAFKVHTDLGKNFIRAINAKTKMVVGQDYPLQNGDVIKIVARK